MKKVIIALLLMATVSAGLTGCSNDNDNGSIPVVVKTYVIVPGAWSAPYAWQSVKTLLEAQGQKVVVVQLQGHGSDATAFNTIHLDDYRDKVIRVIDSVNTKVILVGHSLAGMVISDVAEKVPGKIEKMIYLGAFLPKTGQTLLTLANTDTSSLLGRNIQTVQGGVILDLPHNLITDIFIQDGAADVKTLVLNNYKTEPGIPFTDTIRLTAANYGSVDKYYIHTLQDHAVTMDLQNRMLNGAGLTNIYNINTSHSAFLAKPDSLAILLRNIAK